MSSPECILDGIWGLRKEVRLEWPSPPSLLSFFISHLLSAILNSPAPYPKQAEALIMPTGPLERIGVSWRVCHKILNSSLHLLPLHLLLVPISISFSHRYPLW